MNHPLDETGFWDGVSHIYKLALIKEECCVCLRIFTADFLGSKTSSAVSAYAKSIFSL